MKVLKEQLGFESPRLKGMDNYYAAELAERIVFFV